MNNIKKFKESLKKQNSKGLALDIDETLSFTAGYWVAKIEEKFGVNPEGLTAREILHKYTYIQAAPYWQSKDVIAWIDEARNSNEMQATLPLIENSNHFVNKINKIIPIVSYITIRPLSIVDGTRKWLKKNGFPEVEIIARPKNIDYEDGNRWKADILKKLYPQVIGIVDDNPAIVDFLPIKYRGFIFIYERPYAYKGSLSVIPCSTWEDVLASVKETFT